MKLKRTVFFVVLGVASSPITGLINAHSRTADPPQANYVIDWQVIDGGGGMDLASTNFRQGSSVAQPVVGQGASPSYGVGVGFWYATAGGASCSCPCHGDPQCDGVPNVQDVVETVNVAFRGSPPMCDAGCPASRTDVNCDGVTTIQDVVKMVNVAFRGGIFGEEFCNPCDTPPAAPQECP